MTPRLVRAPRAAVAVLTFAVALVALVGLLVHDDTRGNGFDDAIDRWIVGTFSRSARDLLLHLSDPPLVVGVLVIVVVTSLMLRRWDAAALAVVAPAAAVTLTEVVLKPLVHRSNVLVTAGLGHRESFAYPSGHETGIAALTSVLAVLLLAAGLDRRLAAGGLAVLTLVTVAAAIGLVGNFYHYATDTIGAMGVAVTCTNAVALALDAVSSRKRAPARAPR